MRKLALILAVFVITVSFTTIYKAKPSYPEYVSAEAATFLDKEYVKTIHNTKLNKDLQKKFADLFDQVSAVNVNFSIEHEYYFVAFGEKAGTEKIEMFQVTEHDVKNEVYTFIDFSNADLKSTASRTYWKKGNNYGPPVCPPGCKEYPAANTCLGIICGME